jgi:hypothetical protein
MSLEREEDAMKIFGAITRLFAAEFPTPLAIIGLPSALALGPKAEIERQKRHATLLDRIRRYEYPIDYEAA